MFGAGLPAGGHPRVAETMLETIRVSQTINFRNGFESRMGFGPTGQLCSPAPESEHYLVHFCDPATQSEDYLLHFDGPKLLKCHK